MTTPSTPGAPATPIVDHRALFTPFTQIICCSCGKLGEDCLEMQIQTETMGVEQLRLALNAEIAIRSRLHDTLEMAHEHIKNLTDALEAALEKNRCRKRRISSGIGSSPRKPQPQP